METQPHTKIRAASAWLILAASLASLLLLCSPLVPLLSGQALSPSTDNSKEWLIVTGGNCALMMGQQNLGAIPPRTLLPIERLQEAFANVIHNGVNGWIPLQQATRLGKGPFSAEPYCRRGLGLLLNNDLAQAQLNFFVAAGIEPTDPFYLSFYQYLAGLSPKTTKMFENAVNYKNLKADADRKKGGAALLQKGGLKGGSSGRFHAARKDSAKDKEREASEAAALASRQLGTLNQSIQAVNSTLDTRIAAMKPVGPFHVMVALVDYKKNLSRDSRLAGCLSASNFPVVDDCAAIRKAIAESTAQYEAGLAAINAGKTMNAAKIFEASLQKWPGNKLASDAKRQVIGKCIQVSQLKTRAQDMLSKGDLAAIEEVCGEITKTASDADGAQSILTQAKAAMDKSRAAVTSANQAMDDQRPFDALESVKQAETNWKLNPDIKSVNDRVKAQFPDVFEFQAGLAGKDRQQRYEELVTLCQKLKTNYAKDPTPQKLESDFQIKANLRQDDLKKAKGLEKNKPADALEIYVKRLAMDDAKRLGQQLGKAAEAKGRMEEAANFYAKAGLPNEAKRVRPPPPPAKTNQPPAAVSHPLPTPAPAGQTNRPPATAK
ncbi:MAG: hypothetical protein PHV34_16570 [Verrucomicrobiae bacterium]|nr:hypothetical protein [Verrucomicrobiae bacterium]